jgi:hypothetical protein
MELEELVAADQIILGEQILAENLENKKMSRYSVIDNYCTGTLVYRLIVGG